VLYRYRYLALSVFVLTSAAVMLQGYSGIEYYEAQGRLLIETEWVLHMLDGFERDDEIGDVGVYRPVRAIEICLSKLRRREAVVPYGIDAAIARKLVLKERPQRAAAASDIDEPGAADSP
jgi:hypothetical protein